MALLPVKTGTLMIVRHGESGANAENSFAGWVDTPLSTKGITQAHDAGVLLRSVQFRPSAVYSSQLSRAADTTKLALTSMGMPGAPVEEHMELLERHYGALTGMNKDEARAQFGKEQVERWRRSWDEALPPMEESHPYHPNNPAPGPKVIAIPVNGRGGETLKDVMSRVRAFYEDELLPRMQRGENILVVAHGTSLRALRMVIEGLTEEQITAMKPEEMEAQFGIPNAQPRQYQITSARHSKEWSYTTAIVEPGQSLARQ